jgi:hypothetical protein
MRAWSPHPNPLSKKERTLHARRRLAAAAVSTLLAVLTAGCGPGMVPVSGIVTLDGKPQEGAYVMFVPAEEGRPVTGRTDAQGRYRLSTMHDNDGALEGDYLVCIAMYEPATGGGDPLSEPQSQLAGNEGGGRRFRAIVPLKYTRPETSGLTAKVSADQTSFDFDLSSK